MTHTQPSDTFDAAYAVTAFPLGGIGTGNVSLGARGELRDWEIFNQPAKGKMLPLTFFTIRAQVAGQKPVMRVLEGPIQPPYGLSHGYNPMTTAGLPRFDRTTFRGEYPFVSISFEDSDLPVEVQLEAFTPLIPLNAVDSGIPCAIMTYSVSNPTDHPVAITLVGTMSNPVGNNEYDRIRNIAAVEFGRSVNTYRDEQTLRGIDMTNDQIERMDLNFGSVSLVTDHEQVTTKRYWMRGRWWDYLQEFWDDLDDDGLLDDPPDEQAGERLGTVSLGLVDTLQPGERKSFRFVLTWYFPYRLRWFEDMKIDEKDVPVTRNYYATQWDDAWDVARYVTTNMSRLEGETRLFHDALFGTTLPPAVLKAISANIVPIRSTTCFWLEDGRFFGWEGCFDNRGSCAGNCTHVWSYAYTAAHLFPSLEREMRRTEFRDEIEESGLIHYRALTSFQKDYVWSSKLKPAVDGQMGSILRMYREWRLSGDQAFLASLWSGIKRAIGFGAIEWDSDNDGVIAGIQHNTYDIDFVGPNPLSGVYYLAALRAVEEMALVQNEPDIAQRCRAAFEQGSRNLDSLLWNGEFYIQKLDDVDAYPYQHGLGCLSDQLLGQLHARALGLGDLLPEDHIRTALKSIFDYNFRERFGKHVNCQRTYAFSDESGLLLCTWPHGGRPRLPFPYSDEVWTGIEYQVAAHLIYEGWFNEGIQIVEAVQARHDGKRRNPWNEVECGNHYVRSMSSWTLLLALTGMQGDMGRGEISFAPAAELLANHRTFKTFWSTGRAWGTYTQKWDDGASAWQPSVDVLGGDATGISVTACGQRWLLE